jgi:acetylornithine deacetylase/succinyl-diaminopimelate desuccinylase-like protein
VETGGVRRELPRPGETIDPEWTLYARGAGDDKAPIQAFFAALDALAEAGISPTSNLRFLFEGEEEAGSPHLDRYLAAHREELVADAWLIFDGPVHQSRRPLLAFGVRGYTGFDLTTYGATRYLHSGHYGNWAPNPAMELARLLASMKNAAGEVTIDGFYDSTVRPGPAERQAMLSVPDYDDALRAELGLGATEADNAPLVERLLLPSLNVRGMVSAAVGEAARNVIPTEATASVDIRLAQGNDPEAMLDLVEAHLEAQGCTVIDREPTMEDRFAHPRLVRMERRSGYPAARTSLDSDIARQVTGAVRRAATGAGSAIGEGLEDVVQLPTLGGSLPLYLFVETLDAPVVIVPMANHDDNQHAPNENLRVANLWYGIDLAAAVLTME